MSAARDDGRLVLAANHGALGGGEVMLLRMAHAARDLGLTVQVVAPAEPGDLVAAAGTDGFDVVALPGRSRRAYLARLAAWDRRHRHGLLWCHGLLPGLATAGARDRVVQLHKLPDRDQRPALAIARTGARLVVPSAFLAGRVRRSVVLPNWTDEARQVTPAPWSRPGRVGFLGRFAAEKGLATLAAAVQRLDHADPGAWTLRVAGAPTFVSDHERDGLDAALAPLGAMVDRMGWTSREEFFEGVDVAVFPSVVPESFGLVAAEAMAAGVPFVVSDIGAFTEVAGSEHPWVAPAGDASALAAVVARIAADADTRRRAVQRSRERWERLYSPTAGRRNLAALLAGLGLRLRPALPAVGGTGR